jgi:hypothetical protein
MSWKPHGSIVRFGSIVTGHALPLNDCFQAQLRTITFEVCRPFCPAPHRWPNSSINLGLRGLPGSLANPQ